MSDERSHSPSIDTSKPASDGHESLHTDVNQHDLQRLTDMTAIVTGSTRGIGEGIARRLASEGAAVVVSGRTGKAGEEIANDITDAGGEAVFIQADMADPDDIKHLIEETEERYDEIDILVNNAAAWQHGPFTERTLDDWEKIINVSLRAPWLATKYALEAMPAGGSIINTSSIHALATDPGRFPYNVAKAGLNGMTRSLAIDLGPLDIRVNAIMPGPIRIRESIAIDDDNRTDEIIPANRRGRPDDVASLVAYLGSDESEFITGTTIPVDGGWTICLFDDIDTYRDA